MNLSTIRFRLGATVALTILLSTTAIPACAQSPAGATSLRQDEPATGTRINQTYATTRRLPLDKPYEAMNDDEKAVVASWYEAMPAGDEPPFPAQGLRPIVRAIFEAQRKYRVNGSVLFYVDVDADGSASKVSIMQSVDPDMDRFVASVLMTTPYKPARCNGAPCRMQYPFSLGLKSSY